MMFPSMWVMGLVALLVVDVRTGALEQDMNSHKCHHCQPANGTKTCEKASKWTSVACPVGQSHCATVAVAPDFKSSLTCSAATKTPCAFKYASQNSLQLVCTCSGHLCNAPFSAKLQSTLTNFQSWNNSAANISEVFFKLPIFVNFSDASLYKEITIQAHDAEATEIPIGNSSQITTVAVPTVTANEHLISRHLVAVPRAEALKQDVTAPSDDDEDESEGSGSYQETRSHSNPASAPAAPSSFLPANQNKAPTVFTGFLIKMLLLMYCNIMYVII